MKRTITFWSNLLSLSLLSDCCMAKPEMGHWPDPTELILRTSMFWQSNICSHEILIDQVFPNQANRRQLLSAKREARVCTEPLISSEFYFLPFFLAIYLQADLKALSLVSIWYEDEQLYRGREVNHCSQYIRNSYLFSICWLDSHKLMEICGLWFCFFLHSSFP